jgi:hypothetical protein
MRMGYSHKQILALFRNPHYIGMNMMLQNKGEPFVRDIIADVFARWGRPVAAGILPAVEPGFQPGGRDAGNSETVKHSDESPGGRMPSSTAGGTPAATNSASEQTVALDAHLSDPMGNPIPKLK